MLIYISEDLANVFYLNLDMHSQKMHLVVKSELIIQNTFLQKKFFLRKFVKI